MIDTRGSFLALQRSSQNLTSKITFNLSNVRTKWNLRNKCSQLFNITNEKAVAQKISLTLPKTQLMTEVRLKPRSTDVYSYLFIMT